LSPETPETKPAEKANIDTSSLLAEGEVLHRQTQDGSEQDYFIYRPADAAPDAPLFVAVHDIGRNAEEQARAFTAAADLYGAVVLAPRFAVDRYPNYQRLGRSRKAPDIGQRADVALNSVIEEVASLLGVELPRIHLFGYAAGARFAMRYAMAHPDRVASVVIASAGSYTFPNSERRFPRGLDLGPERPGLRFDPEQFLRVPVTVFEFIGDDASSGGRKLRRVGKSGRSGRERNGRNWVAAMNAAAERLRLEPLASLQEFEGSDHSFQGLAEQSALANRVFEALLGPAPGGAFAVDSMLGAEASPAQPEAAAEARRTRVRRALMFGFAAVALTALLAPVVMWAQYRSSHVVSRDAVVRGRIAEVGSRLDGVIASVHVDAGDRVQAGQVIARLQDSHFQAKVRRARSVLEKATRELEVERLAIANERQLLERKLREVSANSTAASAEGRAVQSLAEEARRRVELLQSLSAKGLMAAEEVRVAETELRTARARASAAVAQRNASVAAREVAEVESEGLAVREKRISVLEAGIESYEAELAVANANLEDSVIRAPDDGAVVRRIIEPGGATVVGQPIISLWMGKDVWVEAWIDEAELADVEIGSLATVSFNSHPDREFPGVVEMISVSTDFELPDEEVLQPRSERMRDAPVIAVRIRLDETEEDLFPGLSASVGIQKKVP
jgi:multidrug resistance efflux pump/poly(3-hydroxybutyrate) depolymerase